MYIDHINIKAPPDLLERVRAFYCELLGLEEGFRPAFASAGHWLYGGGKPIVHLSQSTQPTGEGGGSLDHVAFRLEDGSGFRNRLESAGIPFRSSYVDELGLVQFFLRDPAGNGVEVNFPDRSSG